MANLYFPGCKVKGDFPAASEKLAAYIQSKRVVTPVGCCRVDHDKLTPGRSSLSGRSLTTIRSFPSPITTGRK